MKIKTEIIINATKEKVWEVLTDFEAYQYWNPFIIQSEGKAIVGTKLENTMLNGKGTMTFKPVILTVKPLVYFDWLGSLGFKGIFDGHHYFEIEEVLAGQVKFTQGENFSGILSKLILKKIGQQTRENFEKMNQALKARVEA